MPTLGSLVIQLQADLARLNSDMNKAVGIVDGAMASIRNAAGIAKSALGGLAVGLVGGLGAGALTSSIKAVVDYGDRLNDLSKATDASVEQLSFLDYAAKLSGSSLEGISSSIGRLQKNLIDVANGGSPAAARALRTLNVDARELANADLVTQLGTLGDALNGIKNPAERAATAQALFGKGAREILPFLSEGAAGVKELADRFTDLGATLTTQEAEKLAKLNEGLDNLKTAAGAAAKEITVGLAPSLTKLFETLANGIAPDSFSTQLKARAQEVRQEIATIQAQLAAGTLDPEGKSFFVPDVKLSESAKARFRQTLGELQRELDTITRTQADFVRNRTGGGSTPPPASSSLTDAQVKEVQRLKDAQDAYLDGLRKQLTLQSQTTEAARVQAEIAFGTAAKFDESTKATAVALAAQLDLRKEATEAAKESLEVQQYLNGVLQERNELEAKADQALAQRRQAIIDNLQTPLEKYVETVKELTSPELGLGQATIQRGIAAARVELETAQDKANGLKDVAQELGLTFSSAFEDAIIAGKSFRDILEGIAQDIARLFIRKSITEPLVGALSGAFSGGFSGLFNFGGGGGGGFSNPAALFGNAAGGLYRVGGSGSEHPVAFTARAGEYVAVGTRMAGGGGGEAPVVNVYNQAPVDVNARRGADGRTIEVFVTSAVERNISRGGSRLGKPPIATR